MDKSRRRGAATGKDFWKRFFVSLSLSLLATAATLLLRRHRGGAAQREI
nr:hypothetical protein [uncultured Stomatobaculum sp.]